MYLLLSRLMLVMIIMIIIIITISFFFFFFFLLLLLCLLRNLYGAESSLTQFNVLSLTVIRRHSLSTHTIGITWTWTNENKHGRERTGLRVWEQMCFKVRSERGQGWLFDGETESHWEKNKTTNPLGLVTPCTPYTPGHIILTCWIPSSSLPWRPLSLFSTPVISGGVLSKQ